MIGRRVVYKRPARIKIKSFESHSKVIQSCSTTLSKLFLFSQYNRFDIYQSFTNAEQSLNTTSTTLVSEQTNGTSPAEIRASWRSRWTLEIHFFQTKNTDSFASVLQKLEISLRRNNCGHHGFSRVKEYYTKSEGLGFLIQNRLPY